VTRSSNRTTEFVTTSQRVDALDAFRGLTVFAMILVSTPGTWEAVYWPLEHAAWNGWTPTDLVFPFFLFAMGAAVPVALTKRRAAPRHLRRHIIRRGVMLFALGLLLTAIQKAPPLVWSTFRVPGVLQRIAIVYVIVAWLTERTSRRAQVAVAVSLLLGYWAVMTLVPVPGIGKGVLTPDGSLSSYLDRMLLGGHLAFRTWDPEGLLSTLPAIATALAGVFAGDWLTRSTRAPQQSRHRSLTLWVAGASATALALVWGRVFPINKNLWTSSFALFSAGVAAQVLALCHWVLNVVRWRGWSIPFIALGRNPLAVYFLSIGLDSVLTRWVATPRGASLKWEIYSRGFGAWIVPCCGVEAASVVYALTYVALWTIVAIVLYRRRIFVGI
jgi:predicted acyltransferase